MTVDDYRDSPAFRRGQAAAEALTVDKEAVPESGVVDGCERQDCSPFTTAAAEYLTLGWHPLPLPERRKSPPMPGVTGGKGRILTGKEVAALSAPGSTYKAKDLDADPPVVRDWAVGNVGLRLVNMIGIDVDHYGNKTGADSLTALEDQYGKLPATIVSTSRPDTRAGIRLYRVPEGVKLRDRPGPAIELIQHHHRYVVAWPSIHPDTGSMYRWVDEQTGEMFDGLPPAEVVPELPGRWVEALRVDRVRESDERPRKEQRKTERLSTSDRVAKVVADWFADRHHGRHTAALAAIGALLNYRALGDPGVDEALDSIRSDFVSLVTSEGTSGRRSGEQARSEWTSMVDYCTDALRSSPPKAWRWEDYSAWQARAGRAKDEPKASSQQPPGSTATDDDGPTAAANPLGVRTMAELVAEVDGAKPVPWLLRGIFPGDAYGAMAAEKKAGKTWLVLDLAVAVAAGGAWLDRFQVDAPGPVLVFLGEGGTRKMLRRIRAVAAHKGIGDVRALPLHLAFRVPHLTKQDHLSELYRLVEELRPVLVIIDPLYLAARGAETSSLTAMGEVLEQVQLACQKHGAAALVVHHWNKTGTGKGADRMSGAGLAEWGRVLVSVEKKSTRPGPEPASTRVSLMLTIEGDEVADQELNIIRDVWADDADDLDSTLHYGVRVADADTGSVQEDGPKMSKGRRRLFEVLKAHPGKWMTVAEIGDAMALDGSDIAPLKRQTINDYAGWLVEEKLIVCNPGEALHGRAAWRWDDPAEVW